MSKLFGWVAIVATIASIASTARAQDTVGVAVCDTFLAKYEACIATLRPDRQERLKGNATQLRTVWKGMAADAAQRANLDKICTDVAEGTRKNSTMRDCAW